MLTVTGLRKSYGETRALDDVSFEAAPGEVFAVLGENGAGKSTLLKALAGSLQPDRGEISFNGETMRFRSAREALRAGFVLIPQELAPVLPLSVAENIMLGRLPSRSGFISQSAIRKAAAPFAAQLGVESLLGVPMAELSLAEVQLVEIAKALTRNARVLLLDEPTAALSGSETVRLFTAIDALRERSITMLYISHRLDEVIEHGDQVMVMRDGAVSLRKPVAELSKPQIVGAMIGTRTAAPTEIPSPPDPVEDASPEVLLSVEEFDPLGSGETVDVDVRRGELVALYGVRGAGHEALIETIVGRRPRRQGRMSLLGKPLPPFRTVRQAMDAGIVFVPADRKRHGLVLSASVLRNLTMPSLRSLSTAGLVRADRERALLARTAKTMRLRYRSGSQPVRELSGGNQQKVLVGGRIAMTPPLLAVHEPTRGVDVGARQEIHDLLRGLVARGTAVIMATTDIEEAVELADRLIILRDGRVVAELTGNQKIQQNALSAAVGGQ